MKGAIFWTIVMYLGMTFVFPLLEGSEITLKKSLIAIPIWLIAGFGIAYINKRYNQKNK
jgi:hypothetical protein